MKLERIVWIVALLAVADGGFFTGRMIGVRAGEQNRAQAAQQFFAERGGQQQAGQFPAGGGQNGQTRGFPGVNGTVTAVQGNTITVTTRQGTTTKVELADSGTVRKQIEGHVSDIAVGEQITALGTQNGDVFQATSIQIGGQNGPAPQRQAPAQ